MKFKKTLSQIVFTSLIMVFSMSYVHAQDVVAEDHAGNYSESGFESPENLGTGFGPWNKNIEGDDANITVKDAAGVGVSGTAINTDGLAFALIASESDQSGNKADLGREFTAPLEDGSAFSFQLAWNWADGLKGFTLYNDGWDSTNAAIFVDFDKSGYYVNGDSVEAHASQDDWDTWRGAGVALDVTITRNGQNLDYAISAITEESSVDFSGTVENVNADRINFFNYYQPDWNTDDNGSMFVNNLKITSDPTTSIEDQTIASSFSLDQNYPNPFNPTTNISYTLDNSSSVKLTVYNMLGQKVQILEQGLKSSGSHTVSFDASELSSGIYLYQLQTEAGTVTKKMSYIK